MKQYLLFALIGIFLLGSCDKDDDHSFTPNAIVTKAFNEKYPLATQVKWENKNSLLTVEFINNQLSNTAWFASNGQWYMTETELQSKDHLPIAVQTTFAASEYANWLIDDIDQLERLDAEKLYVIEVKKENQEYDLYYSQDGILIKVTAEDNNNDYEDYLPEPTPSSLTEFITGRYPGARIIEIEKNMERSKLILFMKTEAKKSFSMKKKNGLTLIMMSLNRK